jgi:predicted RNA binding protein YcfA (HicA-like mRNA interferase family)
VGQKDLPLANGAAVVAALERLGWEMVRRANGKHYLLTKPGHTNHISIPDHAEVKRALLAKALKAAGVSESDFFRAFKR